MAVDFWDTFVGAIAGGAMSLAGSYFSAKWQAEKQQSERSKMYKIFYHEQVENMIDHIEALDKIFNEKNYISFQHVDQINVVTDLTNKHSDGFVFIEEKNIRSEVRKFLFDNFYDAMRAKSAQQKIYDTAKKLEEETDLDVNARRQLENSLIESKNDAKTYILSMKERILKIRPVFSKLAS